jgi:CubicO group peptidase (beta-lactamase class C family)
MVGNVLLRQVTACDALSPGALGRRVDTAIDAALGNGLLVGGQIRIARDGQPIYQRNAGVSDPFSRAPITGESVFRLACLSRLLITVAALALVQAGRLALDSDIRQWLAEFTVTQPDGSAARLTVRQLLSHCAGMIDCITGRLDTGPAGYLDTSGADDVALNQHLLALSRLPLLYRPGSGWGNSMATDVMAAVVARCCATALYPAMHELVVAPLRLHGIRLRSTPGPQPGKVFVEGRAVDDLNPGMVGTADDYLALLEALRTGRGVLSKVMVGEMSAVQTGDLQLPGWPGRGFGLGFTVLRNPLIASSPESPGTWRWNSPCGHSWFVDPAQRLSVVAFTNSASHSGDFAFAAALRNAVYGA